jgi:membrane-bound lytic murein transglycosylase B
VPVALASTASYLKHSNWQTGATWGYEVTLPKGFTPKKVSEKALKSLAEWQNLGFARVDGKPFPRPGDKAGLFAPAGTDGR